MERWRPVVGFELLYEISDLGNIRSIRNNHGNPRQRPLKPQLTHDGYLRVLLSDASRNFRKKKHISHMVLEAFVGPRPEGMQACHGPAGKQNNSLVNIRWDTPRANYDDRIEAGSLKGSRHGMATIDEEIARQVKIDTADRSVLAAEIAARYGTSVSIVRNIRNGNSWRWL